MPAPDPANLRQRLRRERRALPQAVRRLADEAITRRLATATWLLNKGRVACYLAADGEPDLDPLIQRVVARGQRLFLPVLAPQRRLRFARFRSGQRLARNRFGMPEPVVAARDLLPAAALDLVLMPLVGFDASGNRLGMGAGYYDRALALRKRTPVARPLLVGVAYSCQCVQQLPAEPWDVPLDGVVTEVGVRWFKLPRAAVACSNSPPSLRQNS